MGYLKKSFLILFCSFITSLNAELLHNKTFVFAPRLFPVIMSSDAKNTEFSLDGFYQQSTQVAALGSTFAVDGTNVLSVNSTTVVNKHQNSFTFANYYFIHDRDNTVTNGLAGDITFAPLRQAWGANVSYKKNIHKNIFLACHIPMMSVTHQLRASVANETKVDSLGVLDFFQGKEIVTSNAYNRQAALTAAKFGGPQSVSGIAAVNLMTGINLLEKETIGACAKLFVSIPTGSPIKGQYLFEPVLGNGRHYEAGLGFDGYLQLHTGNHCSVDLRGMMNVAYGFKAYETRTVGFLKTRDVGSLLLPQYQLFGEIGKTQALIPAANILTMPLLVTPGCMMDAGTCVEVIFGDFGFNAGYAVNSKSAETAFIQSWEDKKYAIAGVSFEANTQFLGNNGDDASSYPLLKSDLDLAHCLAPATLTHKLSGEVLWKSKTDQSEYCLSVGGGYEFAADNCSIEQFELNAKFGLMF